MRAAVARAAIRRGCVWPMSPATPRPSSSRIFGSWVVLPEPVSPQTMTTWCWAIACAMSARLALTGSSSGYSGLGHAARRCSNSAAEYRRCSGFMHLRSVCSGFTLRILPALRMLTGREWLRFGPSRLSRLSLDQINLRGCIPKSPMRTHDPERSVDLLQSGPQRARPIASARSASGVCRQDKGRERGSGESYPGRNHEMGEGHQGSQYTTRIGVRGVLALAGKPQPAFRAIALSRANAWFRRRSCRRPWSSRR